MAKRIPSFIILFLGSLYCHGQQFPKVDSLFKNFRDDVFIELKENHDIFKFDNDTKLSFYTLLANSSINDLLDFTNDNSAVIRAYIFTGLLRKRITDSVAAEILEGHRNDSARFVVQNVDVGLEWTVIDYMQYISKYKNELHPLNYDSIMAGLKQFKMNEPLRIMTIARHNIIDKHELLNIDCLELTDETMKILSFSLTMGETELQGIGCDITKEMKSSIEKMYPGSPIYLENIRAIDNDGNIRHLGSFTLKLM